ncbi:MAG: anthranilate synthase component I family protein [Nitrospirae bacterium]|nr:anthranilate synthase component I family protein [Nitrospirota bacterium]
MNTPLIRQVPFADPADIYTAVRAENTILLDSVRGPGYLASHSMIALNPYLVFTAKDGRLTFSTVDGCVTERHGSPVDALRELVGRHKSLPDERIPFPGGAIGIFSYDFVQYLEKIPRGSVDDLAMPDAHFLFTDTVITVDHIMKTAFVSILPGPRYSGDEAAAKLDELCAVISQPHCSGSLAHDRRRIAVEHELGEEAYMRMVERAKEYIAAGDIFQANLSQRIRADIGGVDPWRIYTTLRSINPSPFAAYMDMGSYVIASSSPERLVRSDGRIVDTRPIAGTRPRGADAEADSRMRAELLINEKERAEHIMLIDLERNDLGKISRFGTVEVNELMVTEDYSHVIHIVSNVRGELLPGRDAMDIVRAVFPGGTITGVPKVRCMEIIDELEPVRRGPYTGSIGYMGFDGRLDLNIVIRTFVIKDGFAYVQAGAGIVADSDPRREYHETLKKAEALIRTIERL